MASVVKPSGGNLLSRLHNWWEGTDSEPANDFGVLESGAPGEAFELDAEDGSGGGDHTARVWTAERIAAVQMVCGEGSSTPGGERFARREIKPLGLNETMSVLVWGAQLGLFARAIARDTGAWVDGLEPEPLLAEAAAQLSARHALAKKAAIREGDLASAGIKDATRDAVIAVETLHRFADRTAQLQQISRMLKAGGQLLLIDFISNTDATSPAIDLWKAYEPTPPDVISQEALRKALTQARLKVRITADITDSYAARLTRGLQGMAKQLIKHPPESAMHMVLLREVHYWGRRLSVLQSGEIGVVRMIAALNAD